MSFEKLRLSKKTVENSPEKSNNRISVENAARAALLSAIAIYTSTTTATGKADASLAGGKREAARLVSEKKRLEKLNPEASDSRKVHETPEGIRYTTE